ncbi:MAG: transposase [Magnetococcales bacterium]|nr:transposase [Magnetococcales bacterium]
MNELSPRVVPSAMIGKSLAYMHGQWDRLIRYIEDGRLEIDNNGAETVIRPFVVGRKNWLFSNAVQGAKASVNLYSLIETAKDNGLDTDVCAMSSSTSRRFRPWRRSRRSWHGS